MTSPRGTGCRRCCLLLEDLHHVGPEDAVREARVVLDVVVMVSWRRVVSPRRRPGEIGAPRVECRRRPAGPEPRMRHDVRSTQPCVGSEYSSRRSCGNSAIHRAHHRLGVAGSGGGPLAWPPRCGRGPGLEGRASAPTFSLEIRPAFRARDGDDAVALGQDPGESASWDARTPFGRSHLLDRPTRSRFRWKLSP